MQATKERPENRKPSIEETRSMIVERLLASAEPDSNENLLVSQIELARHEKQKAKLQARFYTELRRHVRFTEMMSRNSNYWVISASERYLPPVDGFFASMEAYWQNQAAQLPENIHATNELSPGTFDYDHPESGDLNLLLVGHWGLRPVSRLPMNPVFNGKRCGSECSQQEREYRPERDTQHNPRLGTTG